jgi:DNA-binding LacI/PurR family transcriptional regulator
LPLALDATASLEKWSYCSARDSLIRIADRLAQVPGSGARCQAAGEGRIVGSIDGARRAPSMADVAARAGVSHQTVSRVLNESGPVRDQTRERVLAAIREIGYRRNDAARMLATNRSRRIGMIAAHLSLHGPSRIAAAVQDAGHAAGYGVSVIGITDFSGPQLRGSVERLLSESVEALVIAVAHHRAREAAESLGLGIPVVLAQGVAAGQPLAAGIDQEAGALLATQHLLGLGHRQVVYVSGPRDWVEVDQRRAGWRSAHEMAGRSPGAELHGDWTASSGYQAGLAIAADPGTTAVFAANDEMAFGIVKALHDVGRDVPGDISVVGFDDMPLAAYGWPALTTVRQDFARLGLGAFELVVRALAGESRPIAPLTRPTLVVRDSTSPPRTR